MYFNKLLNLLQNLKIHVVYLMVVSQMVDLNILDDRYHFIILIIFIKANQEIQDDLIYQQDINIFPLVSQEHHIYILYLDENAY